MDKTVGIRFNFKTVTCPISELFDHLKTYSGCLSVVYKKPSGIKSVVYLDICNGEVFKSYGDSKLVISELSHLLS